MGWSLQITLLIINLFKAALMSKLIYQTSEDKLLTRLKCEPQKKKKERASVRIESDLCVNMNASVLSVTPFIILQFVLSLGNIGKLDTCYKYRHKEQLAASMRHRHNAKNIETIQAPQNVDLS